MTSAPSPAINSPTYSARSSAISMTRNPASMPGPALPIISPGPVDGELGAIPACFGKTFSFQMYRAPTRREDNPADERVEQGDPADSRSERMDEAILGGGKAWRAGIAALPELRAFPAPALCDLYPMRLGRPEIRTGAGLRDDLRLHDHVPHRRQALRFRRSLRQHHRRARRGARRSNGRQSVGCGIHRGQGRPAGRSRVREAQRRHHPAAISPREGIGAMWENRCKVAVSGVGFSKVTRSAEIPLVAHALIAVKEAAADSGLQISDIDGLATYPELPATGHAEVDGISIVSVNCMMAMLKLPNLSWHIQVGTVNIGGAVQQAVNALLAGVCRYAVVWRAMHNPRGTYQNLPGAQAQGAAQF